MAWEENLHLDGKGSFRGVEFCVSSAQSQVGRSVIVHRYPGRKTPFVQDQNELSTQYNLVCYVVGSDYDNQRDLLRDAFATEGKGTLIHPFWGTYEVAVVSPVNMEESWNDAGMAKFELVVEVVKDEPLTIAAPDAADEVELDADVAAAAVESEFADEFSVIEAIDSVRQTAVDAISSLNSKLAKARSVVNTALNVIDDVGDQIDSLTSLATSLILAPVKLVQAVRGVVGAVMGAISEIDAAFSQLITLGAQLTAPTSGPIFGDYRAARARQAVLDLATNGNDLVPTVDDASGQGTLEAKNQKALVKAYQALSVIEAARAVAKLDFTSRNSVIDLHGVVSGLLDNLALEAGDELFGALRGLQDSFSRRMAELAEALPELVEYTPPRTRPALAIAYDLHGDATRETELIARNRIENPNFVQGQVPLKVVVDG